jgi:hypothetical protein
MLIALLPFCNAIAGNKDSLKIRPLSPQPVSYIIKTNPLPIIWGSVPFTSEFRVLQEIPVALFQSSQIGFSYIGKSVVLAMQENAIRQNNEPRIKVRGFRIQYAHRFYYKRNSYAPEGAYIGPLISYTTAKFGTRYSQQFDHYVRAEHFNTNMMLGYQAVSDDGFTLDAFIGAGYKKNTWQYHRSHNTTVIDLSDIPYYSSSFKFSCGFNIGFAF